jgi:hypothetical protein
LANHRSVAEYLVRLPQLTNFTFQGLDPVPFLGRDTVAHAAVFLGLLDPVAQGLGAMAAIAPACVS